MKKSVLIVDDEETARESLARLLGSLGYDVRTAADSHEAARLLGEEPVHTILLDIDLPHVPGDSFAAFLHIRYPRTRIIFMSGQYDMVDPERFGENTRYFRKPLDLDTLVDSLDSPESSAATAR